jgi:hypothetical protein
VTRRAALAAAALVLALVGCSGGDEEPAAKRPDSPGRALQSFVSAAAAHDAQRMWALLSTPSRAVFGGNLTTFRRRAGALERAAGRAAGRGSHVILAARISWRWAVAAVERTDSGDTRTYAAAFRLENGRWRVEVADAVRIRPLRPDPSERLRRARTQVAAEFKAGDPIAQAGLWLDGRAVRARAGGLGPSYFTAYGESGLLKPGGHSVVAFASTARGARAVAWTFRAPSWDNDA